MPPPPHRLLLLCPPGLESLAAEEARELPAPARAGPAGADLPGRVQLESAQPIDWEGLRLATRVARQAALFPAGDLDELRSSLAQEELPELETAASFRVSAHCGADASLDQQEAARAAGAVLQARHGTRVDLRGFEVEVRLDLGHERAIMSVELHRDPLDRRMKRAKNLRSALKPTIAAGLVRLAGAHEGEGALLDPTCGSGTIAVEAKTRNPQLSVFASDWDEATVIVARGTLENHGLDAEVRHADARELKAAWARRFDAVVFNPPYGVKVGRAARIDRLYREILASVTEVLEPGGRVVVFTPRRKALEKAATETGLRVSRELTVAVGELRPVAFVLEGD